MTKLQLAKVFFKSRKLVTMTVVLLMNWITNCLVYYGLTYNTTELVGNPYVNFTLSAVVELFAVAISHYTLEKFGRKVPYAINMVLSGVSLLLIQFVPTNASWMITVLALIGKFSISFTYNGIYIITAEIYPTVIRNSCVSTCQTFSRFGAVISPQIQLIVTFRSIIRRLDDLFKILIFSKRAKNIGTCFRLCSTALVRP
jgi:OCT family organic cation transporter-like MFS transporter 4/5